MNRVFLLLTTLLVLPLSCFASYPGNVWKAALKQYANNVEVRQLILVKCTEGSNAEVEFYTKKTGKSRWKLVERGSAFIGRNGLGKTVEGDKKTPEGDFGIRKAYGILPNPGTCIPYILLNENIYACDDPEYYNQIIDCSKLNHQCTGEHMSHYVPSYNYGLETTYNDKNVYKLGSAIFFHCKSAHPYTSGCIAVDQDFMKHILLASDIHLRIIIHRK